MSQMPAMRQISNDTPGDATDPNYNFQTIEDHLATEVVNRDGSVAMLVPLSGPPAVNSDEYATLGQLSQAVPVGTITAFGGDAAPDGWALCDGSSVSTTDPQFEALYAVVGDRFGTDGAGNFNLPDLRKRVIVGVDGVDPLFASAVEGGVATTELLEHTHDQTAHVHSLNDHTHKQTDHTHSMNHDHGMVTNGDHNHGITNGRGLVYYKAGASLGGFSGGSTADGGLDYFNTAGDHTHNVVAYNGQTGNGASNGSTAPTLAATGDTGDGAASSPSSTAPTVATGDAAPDNYPPYVVLHQIIKL